LNAPNQAKLLPAVLAIARRAGAEILDVYGAANAEVTAKSDTSPLTKADLLSHRLILAALQKLTPDIPVLSEESAALPYSERSRWTRYWLVDPLDGTKEFLSRNGEFTVNIALIENQRPVLGVVTVPVQDVNYWGIPGQGAWRSVGAGPATAIRATQRAANPVRVVGSKSHRGDSLDAFLARLGPYELLPVGSSLKFCMVAEGAADLYGRAPSCRRGSRRLRRHVGWPTARV
jgi:3'(2'), 5'-bisphosphate nucleotidase